jgi:hypothetical protein
MKTSSQSPSTYFAYARANVKNYRENSEIPYRIKLAHNADIFDNLKIDPRKYSGISNKLVLGVELEVVAKSEYPIDYIMSKVIVSLDDNAICKHDGTVHLNDDITSKERSFEIVSLPGTLEEHKTLWNRFFDKKNGVANLLQGFNTTGGMHVHMNSAAFTPLHILKLNRFINDVKNREFLYRIAGRKENRYTMYHNLSPELTKKTFLLEGNFPAANGRYSSINLTNKSERKKTIEIRVFQSNVSKVGFMKNLEFVDAVYNFTRYAPPEIPLTVDMFLDWLTDKNYPNLKTWLTKWNIRAYKVSSFCGEKFKLTDEEITKCA